MSCSVLTPLTADLLSHRRGFVRHHGDGTRDGNV